MPTRRLLPLCLLLSLGALAGVAGPAGAADLAATPISRLDLPWWRHRFAAKQEELRTRRPDLLFLGDSITQNWERSGPPPWADFQPIWQRFYGARNAVNLGFTGDTTASLLWRLRNGELDGIAPRVAVVLIGANNFGRVHWDAAQTVAGIEAVLDELRRRLPRTRVLLLSILPSERSPWISENTEAANRMLAERVGRDPGVTFLDVTGVFAPDGRLDRSLFYDPLLTPPDPPLHPTAQAQARLAGAIEPTLARMLGEAGPASGR